MTLSVQGFFAEVLNALKGLLAHIMFNAAGVHFGSVFVHTQVHKKAREGLMARINRLGDLPPFWGQRDFTAFVDAREVLISQFFDGYVHGGAFEPERAGDIDLANDRGIAFE